MADPLIARRDLMIIITCIMVLVCLIIISLNKLCGSEEIRGNYLTMPLYDLKDKDLIRAKYDSNLSIHTEDLDIRQIEVKRKSEYDNDQISRDTSSIDDKIVDFRSDLLSAENSFEDDYDKKINISQDLVQKKYDLSPYNKLKQRLTLFSVNLFKNKMTRSKSSTNFTNASKASTGNNDFIISGSSEFNDIIITAL
jgi:hypothetical protein